MIEHPDDLANGEFVAYATAVATTRSEESFAAAFSAFAEYLVENSRWPYETLAGFICGGIEGRAIVDNGPPFREFVTAFAAYAKDAVARGDSSHTAIGRAAWRMLEGLFVGDVKGAREAIDDLLKYLSDRGVA